MIIEITRFIKTGGPLTKRISLNEQGAIKSDGSSCVMSSGTARRVRLASTAQLGNLIGELDSDEAISLGALISGLPDEVEVTTKVELHNLNGTARPNIIARTGDYIAYRPENQAFALLDFDTKGMPPELTNRILDLGGFWPALVSVHPELANVARVTRASTSSGLYRADTGERLPGSNGLHVFILVKDGCDINRFLQTLHCRCWLAGFGWMMVGASGQLLERSIVDRMVGASERLVFEGAPILDAPLMQDSESRQPVAVDGIALDTQSAFPPMTILENAKLRGLRAKEAHRLASASAEQREKFIIRQSQALASRAGISDKDAKQVIDRQCGGILLPDLILPFDDDVLAANKVADVLENPARFEGATLADPLEGPEYGRCKAKIMRRADGTPWIHSFAHGRTTYELKYDLRAIRNSLEQVPPNEIVDTFIRLAPLADLEDDQTEELRNLVAQRSGIGKRVIDRRLKDARKQQERARASESRNRRAAERLDPRPQIEAPSPDAPWLPQMEVLNELLGQAADIEPPMRDLEGFIVQVRARPVPNMHALTSTGINEGDEGETRLPPPELPLLTRLDETQVAELIERHVDYIDADARSVHLQGAFVKHFMCRNDRALPVGTAVATMPMVLPNGTILSGRGLDRERGIVFRVPGEMQDLIPDSKRCTATAVAHAMQFLADDWLHDVSTDYSGKCVLIASALTIMERLLLPERPAFFITAGQRGGGKTTTANMISIAVIGRRAGAAAWSPIDEERRKALFAYLGEGVPCIVWDNIPRGVTISCPSIEKSLTAETLSDRVLGVSETRTVPATTVQIFTGNNIAPRGDMVSRSLIARLEVKRPDPENRKFKHEDAFAWTEAQRGRILAALYTLLIGNQRLRDLSPTPPETRFKIWWHLVGSAVQNAAKEHKDHVDKLAIDTHPECKPTEISFRKMFLDSETDDEQTSSLAIVLSAFQKKWENGATSKEVSAYAGRADEAAIEFKSALEQASGKAIRVVSAPVVSWRLKAIQDTPVEIEIEGKANKVVMLKYTADHHGGIFKVEEVK